MDLNEFGDSISKTPIVIDNGSGVIKAGFGGEEKPGVVFNSYVGRAKHEKVMITTNESELYIGEITNKYKGILKLNYPIEHGIICDFKDMEHLWRHVFDELKVSPKEHPILLTEAPLNPHMNRIKTAEVFFETFGTPSLFF